MSPSTSTTANVPAAFLFALILAVPAFSQPSTPASSAALEALTSEALIQRAHDLLSEDFFVADPGDAAPVRIVRRPRIGVDYAGHWARRLLRFYIAGNAFVSRK